MGEEGEMNKGGRKNVVIVYFFGFCFVSLSVEVGFESSIIIIRDG